MAVLGTQALGNQHRYFEPDFNMASGDASTDGTLDCWAPASWGRNTPMTTTDYMRFLVANARPSDRQFAFQSSFEQINSTNRDLDNNAASKSSFKDLDTHSNISRTLGMSTAAVCPLSAVFTTSNNHTIEYNSTSVSPTDTRFDVEHASPSSDRRFSLVNQLCRAGSPNFATFTDDTNPQLSKRRCDSQQSNFVAYSSTAPQSQVRRRRGSEYAEPGSARAIYLEKNRKAASKCRNKQKRQQEELVQTARDVERRNKLLKAEVEMLRNSLQDLIQLVGQHTQCPDTRLKSYLQREADRLAIGRQRNDLFSSLSASPNSGMGSIEKVSSSEGK